MGTDAAVRPSLGDPLFATLSVIETYEARRP